MLVEHGADASSCALHAAIDANCSAAALWLVEHGCNVSGALELGMRCEQVTRALLAAVREIFLCGLRRRARAARVPLVERGVRF